MVGESISQSSEEKQKKTQQNAEKKIAAKLADRSGMIMHPINFVFDIDDTLVLHFEESEWKNETREVYFSIF